MTNLGIFYSCSKIGILQNCFFKKKTTKKNKKKLTIFNKMVLKKLLKSSFTEVKLNFQDLNKSFTVYLFL